MVWAWEIFIERTHIEFFYCKVLQQRLPLRGWYCWSQDFTTLSGIVDVVQMTSQALGAIM